MIVLHMYVHVPHGWSPGRGAKPWTRFVCRGVCASADIIIRKGLLACLHPMLGVGGAPSRGYLCTAFGQRAATLAMF